MAFSKISAYLEFISTRPVGEVFFVKAKYVREFARIFLDVPLPPIPKRRSRFLATRLMFYYGVQSASRLLRICGGLVSECTWDIQSFFFTVLGMSYAISRILNGCVRWFPALPNAADWPMSGIRRLIEPPSSVKP